MIMHERVLTDEERWEFRAAPDEGFIFPDSSERYLTDTYQNLMAWS